jgi:phosphoribosylglycinamide formyltransferase-1
MKRWAVFLSGRGSNAEALWENLSELDVRLCVSSRKKAYGLLRAQRLGIPTLVLEKTVDWQNLSNQLQARQINQIFLLGFMKLIPADFLQFWKAKIWNLHPSLLPDFPGLEAIEKSYAAGGAMGVSLHEVTPEMDAGPILLQKKICEFSEKEMSFEEAQRKISQTEQSLVRELALRKALKEPKWN